MDLRVRVTGQSEVERKFRQLEDAVTEGKADAVLAASIFHYGTYRIRQCKDFMAEHGVPVRL